MNSSTRSDPLSLAGRRLFITGGTGFIGRSLLDYLAESASMHGGTFHATVLSRDRGAFLLNFPEYRSYTWLSFIEGDLTNLPMHNTNYTDLVHAAADTHRSGDALAWLDQLVQGTRQVLEFARTTGVRRFLFISSGAVYGSQGLGVPALDENSLQAPITTDISSVYAHGKRMAEHLCALYTTQHSLPCVIARCFAILSRHVPLNGPYAAGNFIRDALSAECNHITVRGDGSAVRTYLGGRDMAHWLFTLLCRGVPGEAYNVGSDVSTTMLGLARCIGAQLAPSKPIVVDGREADCRRSIYIPAIDKARSLGLCVETPLVQAITETEWSRSHFRRHV